MEERGYINFPILIAFKSNSEASPDSKTSEEADGDGEQEEDDEEELNDGETDSDSDGESSDSGGNSGITLERDENGKIDITALFHPKTAELGESLEGMINEVLELGIFDMSEEVNKGFGLSGNQAIVWNKASTPLDEEFNQTLARQLAWVKDYKNTKGRQIYRNEPQGKLDGRRLFKASINGLVFKKKMVRPQQDLDLVLLLDASGSMQGRQEIYEDAKALFRAIPEAIILSYEDSRQINITQHTEGRAFHGVKIGGGTPTPQALAATAIKFPKSLLIHFTDGGCNYSDLEKVMPTIHEKFPLLKMVHIQLAEYTHASVWGGKIPEYEGWSKTIIMDSINDFPNRLKEILKEW